MLGQAVVQWRGWDVLPLHPCFGAQFWYLKQLGASHQHTGPLRCITAKTPHCCRVVPALPEAFPGPFLVLQLYAMFYGCVGCKQQMYLKCARARSARCYTEPRECTHIPVSLCSVRSSLEFPFVVFSHANTLVVRERAGIADHRQ